jgi:tellurite resistance protein
VLALLRYLPVGFFGAVMGLAGLGLAGRAAARVLPVPSAFIYFWTGAAALALTALLAAYVTKALRYRDAFVEDLSNPALFGFCAALPVGMTLVAAGIERDAQFLAHSLWWCAVPLMLLLQLRALTLLLERRVKVAHLNGGWLIVLVGGIVMPFAGIPLGHRDWSAAMFGASALAAPIVMGAILYRMKAGPELPAPLRPSVFILLVPPSLIYLNGDTLWPQLAGPALEFLYFVALALAVALAVHARGFWRWPFGASWWAFTFPLDALAGAAARYAERHPQGIWTGLAGALLLLATVAVTIVLVRTLIALARGTLLAAPAK